MLVCVGRELAGLAGPEAGRGRGGSFRCWLDVRDAGNRRQRFIGRARQLGLDLGERPSFGLTTLDRHELQQVPPPVPGDPAPAAERRVHKADGSIPAD
jgi:hypothetical protein